MRVECVVFDVDDTLYLERDYVHSGFRTVGSWADARLGIEGFGATCWALFEAGVRGAIFDRAIEEHGLAVDRDLVGEMVSLYREHSPDITLLPDVSDFFATSTIERRAAITDGPATAQHRKVRALDLGSLLDPILVTDDLGPGMGKPNPAAFRSVENALGVRGRACCYIGDNPLKDFVAPRELGWLTIRVRREGGLHHDASSGTDVDYEISTFSQLVGPLSGEMEGVPCRSIA